MNKTTYREFFEDRYGVEAEGPLTEFLTRRDGRLLLDDRIDLAALASEYGAPLEVAFLPLITKQVQRMVGYAAEGRARTGYSGNFLYAYATKANFSEEVVRTALGAGAHYETSAAADVVIAHHLWRQGILSEDRYIFCNGSKERPYLDAIRQLRRAGFEKVVPILDDLQELDALIGSREPFLFGVRERTPGDAVNPHHPGGERFGLTQEEIAEVAERLAGTRHQLVVYHAMIGSQVEDLDYFMERLSRSVENYCRLRRSVPSLSLFNFGGGVPTSAYAIDFEFDYAAFFERLMRTIEETCERYGTPVPNIIGEFGRYTVASHSVYLFEVGRVKEGQGAADPWYLINGSMMVSVPDTLIVEGQKFVILPLDRWDAPVRGVRLAGRRTCDSDDLYPRPADAPLPLPADGEGMVVAVFGVGAYQSMIAGKGGAHHCLNPEMARVIFEEQDGRLVMREVAQQNVAQLMRLLGYETEVLEPAMPAYRMPVVVDRPGLRESCRRGEASARRSQLRRRASARYRSATRGGLTAR